MSQKRVSVFMGGTGANTAAGARSALGVVALAGDTMTGNLVMSGATVNTATANISTIVTGNVLTISTGTSSNGNIIFSANGTEDMRIVANGYIGIGTINPASSVDIFGLQTNSGASSASSPSGTLRLAFVGGANTNDFGSSIVFTQHWFTGSTTQIGVGQISGVKIDGNGNFGGGLAFWTSNGTNNNLLERMRITNTGNTGIGTTNPIATTQIRRSSNGTALLIQNSVGGAGAFVDLDFLTYANEQVGYANSSATIRVIDDNYSGHMTFRNKGNSIGAATTERMRIASNGYVGIATTNPGSPLHIFTPVDPAMKIEKTAGWNYIEFINGGSRRSYMGLASDNSPIIGSDSTSTPIRLTGAPVLISDQPAFTAVGNQSWQTYGSEQVVQFNAVRFNTGGHYNTTNSRFTAPVAGRYLFTVNCYTRATSGVALTLYINGAQYVPSDLIPYGYRGTQSVDNTVGFTILLNLNASDYVDIRIRSGNTNEIYTSHSHFSGHLIG